MSDRRRLVGVASAALVLTLASTALAQSSIEWSSSEPLSGVVDGDELYLDVEGAGVSPLLVIDEPGVQPPTFAVEGTIRHEDVVGIAYLEMWTVLPDDSRYFTRTLAESGPLGYMTGSAEQRSFSLPFDLGEGGPVPSRLEINLVTEGSGRFWVGPLTLLSSAGQEPTTTSTQAVTTTAAGDAGTASIAVETTAVTSDEGNVSSTGWWLALIALVVAAGAGAFAWWRSVRRRRTEEQRKMDAMDSLRS